MMGSRIINCLRRKAFVEDLFQKTVIFGSKSLSTGPCLLDSASPKADLASSKILPENNISEERAFLVRLKTDPDTFGTPRELEVLTEDDFEEEKFISEQPLPSQRLRTKQYAEIIKKLISERKIKEALDLVEVRMLKEDRVKPENYIYNLLLGACGRVGYTKKAFQLYNDMKRRGLEITGGTYTALANACANSPWPLTDGLTRLRKLYEIMIEKGYEPNESNYNAIIKAFGRCGDLPMAFTLVDQMTSKGWSLQTDTMNFVLQACISDKEAGFRHTLLVWRKMVDKNIKPDIFTFNLILRSMRDCRMGDLEVTQDVISQIVTKSDVKLIESGEGERILSIGPGENEPELANQVVPSKEKAPLVDLRPNLLAKIPHLGNVISLSEVNTSTDRLLLVGGCRQFVETMKEYKCQPDIKTFSQLLNIIPSTEAAEKDLLAMMKNSKVKFDVDFFNMLIKKRSMRSDYESAKEVLLMMDKANLRPDLITYGVLAIGCKTKEECLDLIELMNSFSYRLNSEILGAMLHQACYHFNYHYVMEVMNLCIKEDVKPNKTFMAKLSSFRNICRDQSFKKQLTEIQERNFHRFKVHYKEWLNKVEVDTSEDEHPWQQFREKNDTDAKNYTWKDSKSRFKPKHTSYFRNKLPLKEWKQQKLLKLEQKSKK